MVSGRTPSSRVIEPYEEVCVGGHDTLFTPSTTQLNSAVSGLASNGLPYTHIAMKARRISKSLRANTTVPTLSPSVQNAYLVRGYTNLPISRCNS
jgi:hypothetical protein